MGCSISVHGVRDLDVDFKEMIAIAKMCKKKNVSLPKEVIEYFEPLRSGFDSIEDMKNIDEKSVGEYMSEVSLTWDLGKKIKGLTTGDPDCGDGMIIDLSKLPQEIKKLRIYMSC